MNPSHAAESDDQRWADQDHDGEDGFVDAIHQLIPRVEAIVKSA
jgi:hypothetical protein